MPRSECQCLLAFTLNPVPLLKCKAADRWWRGSGSSARKWTEHEFKRQRDLISCITLGRLSNFSDPHFSHLPKEDDNELLGGFNYRHSWMCLNKRSSSLIRPFCPALQFWLTSLHTMLVTGSEMSVCMHLPLTTPSPSTRVLLCARSLSHTHTHTHVHTRAHAHM